MRISAATAPDISRSAGPPAARIQAKSFASETRFELKVRTEDGDTVTLKLSRSAERESLRGRTAEGGRFAARSRAVSEQASVEIEGQLSDEEAADIQELLSGLQSGQLDTEELDSLAGFSLNYQQTTRAEQARLKLYA